MGARDALLVLLEALVPLEPHPALHELVDGRLGILDREVEEGRRGRYAARLEALAKRAKAKKLGLWGACPRTRYDPYQGIETRR